MDEVHGEEETQAERQGRARAIIPHADPPGGRYVGVTMREPALNYRLQIYQEKVIADKNAKSENGPILAMADFVINFMLFKFGTKRLVQQRIASLIVTLQKVYKSDPVALLFARFCGVVVRVRVWRVWVR